MPTLDKIFVGQKRQNFSWVTKILSDIFLSDKVACINPSDGFQTLATNDLKPWIFSSNLLLVSQELFSNDYKKARGIDIFNNFRNFS